MHDGRSQSYPPMAVLLDQTLDRSVLAQFRDEDDPPDFVISLIDLFLHETESQVDSLRTAGYGSDMGTLKAIAHSLKGSSMTMGAKRLGSLCAEIEARAARQERTVITDLIADVDREFVKVRSALIAERPVQR
jgi:HPt (histidine-containing phosphotransfer) domain-containing protein